MTIQQARERGEALANAKLDDETFQWILRCSYHKARTTGHSPKYVPILLVDEIKDHFFRQRINLASRCYLEMLTELSRKERSLHHAGVFLTKAAF